MLVQASADQEIDLLALPLVLEEESRGVGRLAQVAAEPEVFVVQRVVVVLDAGREVRREEEQPLEGIGILCPGHNRHIVGPAVGRRVLLGPEVAVTVDVLRRQVDAQAVAVVGCEPVELQAAAVDLVVQLLGDVGHVGRLVEGISAAPELVDVVVLGCQPRVGRGLVVGPEPGGLGVELRDVRETVVVAVVGVARAHHAEKIDTRAVVVRDERTVERGVEVGRAPLEDIRGVAQRHGVAQRLLGDDVDHTADGIRPEQRRAASADHLDPLDHGDGQLFKAVDRCQRTEDRAAVEQYLRILPFESVYAQLGRTAVAAVGFDAQSRLEIHRLGQIARGGRFEEFGRGHRYDSR